MTLHAATGLSAFPVSPESPLRPSLKLLRRLVTGSCKQMSSLAWTAPIPHQNFSLYPFSALAEFKNIMLLQLDAVILDRIILNHWLHSLGRVFLHILSFP